LRVLVFSFFRFFVLEKALNQKKFVEKALSQKKKEREKALSQAKKINYHLGMLVFSFFSFRESPEPKKIKNALSQS
jgi:hypothetical protein